MSKRFGRQQKRAMRARVAALEAEVKQERAARFAPWGQAPESLPDIESFFRVKSWIKDERCDRHVQRAEIALRGHTEVTRLYHMVDAYTPVRFRGFAAFVKSISPAGSENFASDNVPFSSDLVACEAVLELIDARSVRR